MVARTEIPPIPASFQTSVFENASFIDPTILGNPQLLQKWVDSQETSSAKWFLDHEHLYPKVSQEQLAQVADHFREWLSEADKRLSVVMTYKEAGLRARLVKNGMKDFSQFDRALNVLYFSEMGLQTRKEIDPLTLTVKEAATHQLEVAQILAQEGVNDPTLMVAAILHDTIENTTPLKDPTPLGSIRKDEIAAVFGDGVAEIVDLLSKVKNVNDADMTAETQKKIFESLIKDPRAVLIKMADRLHSMRIIGNLSVEKQKTKALETMEIYVPLAKRLGLHDWYREMARLSLNVLYGEKRVEKIQRHYASLYPSELMQQMGSIVAGGSDLYKDIPLVDVVNKRLAGLNLVPMDLELHYNENGQDYTNIQDNDYPILCGVLIDPRDKPYDFSTYAYQILRRLSQRLDLPGGFRIRRDIKMPLDSDEKGLFYYSIPGDGGRRLVIEFATEEYFEKYSASLIELYRGDEVEKQGSAAILAKRNVDKLQADFQRIKWMNSKRLIERSAKEVVEEFKNDLAVELITVSDKDGRLVTFPKGATVLDLASDIGKPLCYLATEAKFKYPDGYELQVGLDEQLVDGVKVEILIDEKDNRDFVEKMLEQKDSQGNIGNYQGMLDRFRIAKTYKAKELIAQRLRKHMKLEAANAGFREQGTFPYALRPETPLINEVRERGKDILKWEVGRRLRNKNIWPGRQLINGRMLTEFGAQYEEDGTIILLDDKHQLEYWDFLEQVGLERIVLGGRRSSFIERVIKEMIRVQNNLVRVNISIPDIPGIAGTVYSIIAAKKCNLIYDEGREHKVKWDDGKVILILTAKDAEKLEGPDGIISQLQRQVPDYAFTFYTDKLHNYPLERRKQNHNQS